MSAGAASIRFVIGSRQLYAARRRLTTVAFTLEQLLSGDPPALPPLDDGSDGYRLFSVPSGQIGAIRARLPGFLSGGRQDYHRRYIAMEGSFADYMATFSGKTRSTLKRKVRKLAEHSGGALDIEAFRRPEDVARFFAAALPLSDRTYQARLLGAGLPSSPEFIAGARELAAQDRLRAYLLRVGGEVAAYLYLPVEGRTLVYAYLGYAPELAHLSPGTVLQLEALEALFAERRFTYFDFTEGDGSHKALFGTGSAAASSLFLLRPSLANRMLLASLDAFDGSVAAARQLAERMGAKAALRRVLRR